MSESESAIRTSESIINISKSICKFRKEISGKFVPKSKENTFHKYAYAEMADYLTLVDEPLMNNDLFLISSVKHVVHLQARLTGKGSAYNAVEITITTRLVHSSGEFMEIDTVGEGEDSNDKAPYKATTGSRKYGIACILGLATQDDPEKNTTGNSGYGDKKPQYKGKQQYQNNNNYQNNGQVEKQQSAAAAPANSSTVPATANKAETHKVSPASATPSAGNATLPAQNGAASSSVRTVEHWKKVLAGQANLNALQNAYNTACKQYFGDSPAIDSLNDAFDKCKEKLPPQK